jgi:hypothetical protein
VCWNFYNAISHSAEFLYYVMAFQTQFRMCTWGSCQSSLNHCNCVTLTLPSRRWNPWFTVNKTSTLEPDRHRWRMPLLFPVIDCVTSLRTVNPIEDRSPKIFIGYWNYAFGLTVSCIQSDLVWFSLMFHWNISNCGVAGNFVHRWQENFELWMPLNSSSRLRNLLTNCTTNRRS